MLGGICIFQLAIKLPPPIYLDMFSKHLDKFTVEIKS